MKKLRLNKLFHWLYAFLMLYPVLCFFGTWIVISFNNSVSLDSDFSMISSSFFNVIDNTTLGFDTGTVGRTITSLYYYVFDTLFGPEVTDISVTFSELLAHWTIVSLVYLVFDVIMLPINICHHWIDKGSDRL